MNSAVSPVALTVIRMCSAIASGDAEDVDRARHGDNLIQTDQPRDVRPQIEYQCLVIGARFHLCGIPGILIFACDQIICGQLRTKPVRTRTTADLINFES